MTTAGREPDAGDAARGVELAYALPERRGRRIRRALRRWWWGIALIALVAVWYPNRHEVWRKGVVLWRQRELANLRVAEGQVAYESDPQRAAMLRPVDGEYEMDWRGRAGWYPPEWRGFPWREMPMSLWIIGHMAWNNGWAEKGLVYSGYLMEGPTKRWVVVLFARTADRDGPVGSGGRERDTINMGYLNIWVLEPETLRRRGSLSTGPTEVWLGAFRSGRYRVFAGHRASDTESAFEFDIESECGRETVRVGLEKGGSFAVTRKETK